MLRSVFVQVRPALMCLEALGAAVEEKLHLLLPAIVRLVTSGQVCGSMEQGRG